MENQNKELLLQKLETSLQEHAKALGQASGAPDLGKIYELKEMTVLYQYLSDEHELTQKEADALLAFENPMEVALACWESNTAQYGFDICDIMEAINCWADYPLA